MPVPLSTAFIAAGAVFLPISEIAAGVLAGLGLLNQAAVTLTTRTGPSDAIG